MPKITRPWSGQCAFCNHPDEPTCPNGRPHLPLDDLLPSTDSRGHQLRERPVRCTVCAAPTLEAVGRCPGCEP